jgi:uncharacterized protein with HEPN domain
MPPDQKDPAYLWDMLNDARQVQETLADLTYSDYLADDTLRLATGRRI